MSTPRSIVALAKAEEADRKLYVTESPTEVILAVTRAKANDGPLVSFTRVCGGETVEFATQPGNVLTVEEYVR